MKIHTILNILAFTKNINRFILIIKKIFRRFIKTSGKISNNQNIIFLEKNCENLENFFSNIDKDLWKKSKIFQNELNNYAKNKLAKIEYDLGGGGAYNILYFLTKLTKPETIYETGVGAGFSTFAFLKAMKENDKGTLYSSDFPYFRIKNPENYIGILVPQNLKKQWKLMKEGDEANTKFYKKNINKKFDILHYDSDKTYLGRSKFFKISGKLIDTKTLIIMDDIQDNSFFYDFVIKNKLNKWKIFSFENKYVGMIYNSEFINF